MGVYIKKLQAKKVEAIFTMLGLHIEDGDIIEVSEPHGRLIGEDALARKIVESNYGVDFINKATALIMDTPTVIESEGKQ